MKQIFNLHIFIVLLLLLSACKNSPTSASGAAGTMVGYVYAIDTLGGKDSNGVRISLDGTNYSTMSQASGKWEMSNIPPGTYNISYTKDGYATEKNIAYRFVGNGTDFLFSTAIYQIGQRNVSFVLRPFEDYTNIIYNYTTVVDSNGTHNIEKIDTIILPLGRSTFTCRLFRNSSNESLTGNAIILFGKSENMSAMDPTSYISSSDNSNYRSGGGTPDVSGYIFYIYRQYLLDAGFKSGDKVFCEAFASNMYNYENNYANQLILQPSYYDIASGKYIYTGFANNHSEVKSFILP